MFDFKKLDSADWRQVIDSLYLSVKPEMQGPQGFIRRMKALGEPSRKHAISGHMNSFNGRNSLVGLDLDIDALADQMMDINHKASSSLYYDYLSILEAETDLSNFPTLKLIQDFVGGAQNPKISINRLNALLARVINESLSQANKSNAGEAGENIVRAILSAAGLQKDVHFREQYQSSKGSDTDFVFPCVPDGQDGKVEAFLAVQMSSNDRTRLTSSELRQGAVPFVFTGNGLAASKKKLKDIGNKIILDQRSKSVRIVCLQSELDFEMKRLTATVDKGNAPSDIVDRLDYFDNFGFSMEAFADYVRKRFL
ncbi:hypothetical protein [Yoonia sp. R78084]|uniref:hypothetical protein n=1 Tax=Yoonia sp. R78084 TaxID=3093869 RepID=UPI0037DCBD59